MDMKNLILVATWAFCIIIGALMITPEGFVWINVNPAITKIIGVIGIAAGIAGFVMNREVIFKKKG